jgi:lipopolysaccharide/colanic/teichoic acid biosynthesis glycosyltransferase
VHPLEEAISREDKNEIAEENMPLNIKQSLELKRSQKIYLPFKRFFDILLSSIALIVLSPMFLIVTIIIKFDSPGSALFVQNTRVGKNGKLFPMLKFRSMVQNADAMKGDLAHLNEMEGPVFKIKNDPRLTRIGRVLRKTSIDELPQLVNILIGQMSIVGPRPFLKTELDQSTCGRFKIYCLVKPGLTSLWGVSGRSNINSFDQRMILDIEYVQKLGPIYDLMIFIKTIPAVISGDGAS